MRTASEAFALPRAVPAGMLARVPVGERDDDELLTGGEDEFAEFYRRHVHPLLGYLVRQTRDPEAAADIVAETFAAALVARRRYRPAQAPARAWLYGIAQNKLADWRRKGYAEDRARRRLAMQRIELTDEDREEIERLGDDLSVIALFDELPSEQRHALRERYVRRRAYSEIASDLEVSEAVVRKRVSRGVARLRDVLGGRR